MDKILPFLLGCPHLFQELSYNAIKIHYFLEEEMKAKSNAFYNHSNNFGCGKQQNIIFPTKIGENSAKY